jgi:hypothetical protein
VSRQELQTVLDFILNKASKDEFDVIAKACQRRAKDLTLFAGLGGEGPNAMAKRMAGELQSDVGATMENVRRATRGFIEEMVRKEAPEITEAELAGLLDEYAPPPEAKRKAAKASALPPSALLDMTMSFVDYSRGAMPPSRQRELWESSPRWQDEYWAALPAEVKALVKAYIEDRIDAGTFGNALLSVLGL